MHWDFITALILAVVWLWLNRRFAGPGFGGIPCQKESNMSVQTKELLDLVLRPLALWIFN